MQFKYQTSMNFIVLYEWMAQLPLQFVSFKCNEKKKKRIRCSILQAFFYLIHTEYFKISMWSFGGLLLKKVKCGDFFRMNFRGYKMFSIC